MVLVPELENVVRINQNAQVELHVQSKSTLNNYTSRVAVARK
jgi:hypothetical protein